MHPRTVTIPVAIVTIAFVAVTPRVETAQLAQGPSSVVVGNVNTQRVGSTTLSSSARLSVAWVAPTGPSVDHYEIRAVEAGSTTQVNAAGSQTSVTLTGLKASTSYSVTVTACLDAGCVQSGVAEPVAGMTSAEYWQVQGTGGSASGATRVAPNVMAWPVLYGAEAGRDLQGKVRLYLLPENIQQRPLRQPVVWHPQ